MLKRLRENMKVILWVTIIAFVALIFLAWGMDIQSGGGRTPDTIAKVNGQVVTNSELETAIRNTFDTYRQQFGRQPSDAEADGLRDQAWESLVQRILIAQEAQERGLTATDEEVVYSIRMDPPQFLRSMEMFQTDGSFDPRKFRQALSDPLMDWTALEYWVRSTLPVTKLQELVTLGAKVTEGELRETYVTLREMRTISYIFVDPLTTPFDESQITESRVREYYSENKDLFTVPEQAKLGYLFLEVAPSAADSAEMVADLGKIAEQARGGEDFAELAQIHSEDPTAEQGGDPGNYFKKGDLNSRMEEVLFSLEVGEVSDPFLDPRGYHIVKLEDRTTVDGEEQVSFRNILRTVSPSQTTINLIWDKVQRIQTSTASGLSLAEAARAEGMEMKETPYFGKEGFVPGLAGLPEAKEMAFKMKQNTVRGPIRTYMGHYFLELLDRKEERLKPFDEAREECRRLLLNEIQADLAYEKATSLAEVAVSATLEGAAEAESLEVKTAGPFNRVGYITGIGRDHDLIGACFAASTGHPPLAVQGERGSYVVRVDEVEEPDMSAYESQKEELRDRLLLQKQGKLYTAWISALEEGADIKDYRERY